MTKPDTPTLAIEIWDVDKLVPYERNAKKHPEDQVEKLATSITKFGWTQPIVVWTNGDIIAGHGRRLAAISLGMTKVPVVVRSDLSQVEADALRLADNRVTSTDYDQALIQEEMQLINLKIGDLDLDLQLTDLGFDEKEVIFIDSDMGEMNFGEITDDISGDVERQRQENEASIENTDGSAAPVGDALGFKRVTVMQSREIRSYMSRIEIETGEAGVDALLDFFKTKLGDAA